MQAAPVNPPSISAEAEQRLRLFAALLGRWTQRINLVSRRDVPNLWQRHVLDSLRLAPLLPAGAMGAIGQAGDAGAIDLGSGAGLPGLVLAIATGVRFDLVEADKRKAAFLTEAAAATAAPVRVHAVRIETVSLPPAAVVTARALAPLPVLLGLAAPLLAPGGTLLFPKGAQAAGEIEAARALWRFELETLGPADSPILRITDPQRV